MSAQPQRVRTGQEELDAQSRHDVEATPEERHPGRGIRIEASIFLLCFSLLILFPFFGTLRGQAEKQDGKRLGGVEFASSLSSFTWETFLDGSFQTKFQKWFSSHLGYRSILIRSNNQLDFSLFGAFSGRRTIIGKKNYLFQSQYIEDYNGLYPVTEEAMNLFVDKLRRLQIGLKGRGSKLMIFLTPSKAAIIPELLPSQLRLSDTGPGTYERFLAKLQTAEIPVLDGIQLAKQLKAESPYPVFPPGAAHWSSYVSCKAGEKFTQLLGPTLGRPVPLLSCDPPEARRIPQGVDQDLAELTNIWDPSSFDVPLVYPKVSVSVPKDAYFAKTLFIGDSFLWTFLHYLERKAVYESRDFFYYYRSQERFRRRQRPSRRTPIEFEKLDWNYLFKRDVVVIELNEIRIREGGFGFVEDALAHLDPQAPHSETTVAPRAEDEVSSPPE